jgi:hypothetical protein
MKQLKVELEHCFGIKALSTEFDFSKSNAFAIYAPNGVMKSSLTETFKSVASGSTAGDRLFTNRNSSRSITDETGRQLTGDEILVVLPAGPRADRRLAAELQRTTASRQHRPCAAVDLLAEAKPSGGVWLSSFYLAG